MNDDTMVRILLILAALSVPAMLVIYVRERNRS